MDGSGIDWWDVLSLMIEPDLRQLMLIGRLARELPGRMRVSMPAAPAPWQPRYRHLQGQNKSRWIPDFDPACVGEHYHDVFTQLDGAQMSQAFQDKFDREHFVRRRLPAGGGA